MKKFFLTNNVMDVDIIVKDHVVELRKKRKETFSKLQNSINILRERRKTRMLQLKSHYKEHEDSFVFLYGICVSLISFVLFILTFL